MKIVSVYTALRRESDKLVYVVDRTSALSNFAKHSLEQRLPRRIKDESW